jgi:hypothetical protein
MMFRQVFPSICEVTNYTPARRRDTRKGVLGIIGGLLRHIKKLYIDKLFLKTKNAFLTLWCRSFLKKIFTLCI